MNGQWIGVDPGSRFTGIAARDFTACLTAAVIDADDNPATYRLRIIQAITTAHETFTDDRRVMIAIEGINPPKPYINNRKTFTRPADLITLSRILGYLEHAFPHAILIPPNHHGSQPWGTYPPQLITPNERRHAHPLKTAGQHSTMRHARSAWDITLTAGRTTRTGART